MARVSCSLDPEDFQQDLFATSGPKISASARIASVPSELLGLGKVSTYESPWEKCPVCRRSVRRDSECLSCYSN